MTSARRTFDRMTCPSCGRQVAFWLVPPFGIRKPMRHKRWKVDTEPPLDWCPAGEPLGGGI